MPQLKTALQEFNLNPHLYNYYNKIKGAQDFPEPLFVRLKLLNQF